MGLDYAWEKTLGAVTGMATSPASINERIADAFANHLLRIDPAKDLPPYLQGLYAQISSAMTAIPAEGDEGSARASARAMTEEQATAIARKIVDLYDRVLVEKL